MIFKCALLFTLFVIIITPFVLRNIPEVRPTELFVNMTDAVSLSRACHADITYVRARHKHYLILLYSCIVLEGNSRGLPIGRCPLAVPYDRKQCRPRYLN